MMMMMMMMLLSAQMFLSIAATVAEHDVSDFLRVGVGDVDVTIEFVDAKPDDDDDVVDDGYDGDDVTIDVLDDDATRGITSAVGVDLLVVVEVDALDDDN